MDISFAGWLFWRPVIIGLVALLAGVTLVLRTTSLFTRLAGVILALGGSSFMLAVIPNSWVPAWIKALAMTALFIALCFDIARSGWSKDRNAVIVGSVLVAIGCLAAYVQIQSYVSLPGGTLQQIIENGFASLSQIFGLAAGPLQ